MQFKGYTLNGFQVEAARAIAAGKNVLLSAPTGSGKTLVAEYAIEEAVAAGRRVVYTAPIKALSNQKFRDFKADGLDVGLMTGDLTLNPGAQVVIMTTEIFRNAVFEDPERFDDVEFAVFDEIHFLDDVERGTVWEESLIFAPDHVRFVGLSATIANLEQFGAWLADTRRQELAVIRHVKRPVPLENRCFHIDTGVFDLAQRRRAEQTAERLRAQGRPRRAGRGRPGEERRGDRRRGGGREDGDRRPHPARVTLDFLQGKNLLPVLFFCFSRKECEIKAARNLHRRLLDRRERLLIEDKFDAVCKTFELDPADDPALRGILQRAQHGVGFHHAGMLPIHKEIVERLFTSGLLKLLFTTETFALGINMPARTVVFDSLRKFDGVSFDYMRARDYMQMAGRAGRQGLDDSGLVISILDDEALVNAPLPDLFNGKVEPIRSRFNLSYSTILNLWERMGADLVEAYDRSFAAWQQAAGGSRKRRDKMRSLAHANLHARISVLQNAGYIDPDRVLLSRGKVAQHINGYEIQTTELLVDGVLDDCSSEELAAVFCALVHEPRRGQDRGDHARCGMSYAIVKRVQQAVRRFQSVEARHGFEDFAKSPDFGLSRAVLAWAGGCSMTELTELAGADGGDVVRTMRMAIQMMRQLRSALSGDYALIDRLAEGIVAVNRDAVDAKRQFELG